MRNKTILAFLLAAAQWPAANVTAATDGTNAMPGMSGMEMSATKMKLAPVKITGAWIRALPSGLPAGGYFALRNDGDKTLELTAASSPSCGMLMLHKSESTGGMSHMSDVTSIEIAPKATLTFAPGGYHLMCMKPKNLKPGDTASVTLTFADGSQADADFAVKTATGN
jgi:copper(I)-binding protein